MRHNQKIFRRTWYDPTIYVMQYIFVSHHCIVASLTLTQILLLPHFKNRLQQLKYAWIHGLHAYADDYRIHNLNRSFVQTQHINMRQRTTPQAQLHTFQPNCENNNQLHVHTSIRQIFSGVFISTGYKTDRLIERSVKQIVSIGLHKLPTIRLHYNQLLLLLRCCSSCGGGWWRGEAAADGCCRPPVSAAVAPSRSLL